MSQLIRNIACFEMDIPSGNHSVPLDFVNINDKTIQSVYFFSSTEDVLMFSPISGKQITQLGETGPFGIYMNLYDEKENHFIKDYASDNFTIQSEMDHYVPYVINRKIDWEKSYLKTIVPDETEYLTVLIYVLYKTEKLNETVCESPSTISIELLPNEDFQDFCLADYVSAEININMIANISVSKRCSGYIDINAEKSVLENVPAHFFEIQSAKGFQTKPLKINLNQFFYRHRSFSREPVIITLSYTV